jgi:hypothetical protein
MAIGFVSPEHRIEQTDRDGMNRRLPAWLPYLLALFLAIWPLRDIRNASVTETDSARHAMNGAFIYDLVRTGHLLHPIQYAKDYYGRLPALSMPFHPPVFPAIEALFYAVLGVNLVAARLAVCLSVGLCALLMYRLVQATLRSDLLAACVTVTTLSAWTAQFLSTSVMLEFPSLAFALAALYCLRDFPDGFSISRALLFGSLAATALWTKQHAVFLAGVPFLYVLFTRRWRMLLQKPLWISTAIIGIAIYSLVLLSAPFNYAGTNRVSTSLPNFLWNMGWNVLYYRLWFTHNLLELPGIFAACSLVAFMVVLVRRKQRRPSLAFYWAWILSVPAVLLLVSAADWRYLIYLLPALFAVAYEMQLQCAISLWGKRGWILPAGFAAIWVVAGLFFQPEYLRGPAQVAAFVERGTPVRVLYAGEADGNFIFSARSLDPKLQTIVIPAAKLPKSTFGASNLENFCRRYGINWVVFEDVNIPHSWSSLRYERPSSLRLERSFPLESTRPRWTGGTMRIYRFLDVGEQPAGDLQLPVQKLGDSIQVKF